MRHRVRWGLTIATVIVLVIGAVSCGWGVWVFRDDGAYREVGVSLVRATVYANYADRSSRASLMSRMPQRGWHWHADPAAGSPIVNLPASFEHQATPFPSWALRVPLWIPLVLLGGPAVWLWWRHVKRPAHACEQCGYDLRGTPGPTCPECGQTIAHRSPPSPL